MKVPTRKCWLTGHASWYFSTFRKNAIHSSTPFLSMVSCQFTGEFYYKGQQPRWGKLLIWTKVQWQGRRTQALLCLVFTKETGFIKTERSQTAQSFGIFQSKFLETAFLPGFCTHTFARTHKHQLWNSQNLKHSQFWPSLPNTSGNRNSHTLGPLSKTSPWKTLQKILDCTYCMHIILHSPSKHARSHILDLDKNSSSNNQTVCYTTEIYNTHSICHLHVSLRNMD